MNELDDRESTIVALRYGLNGHEPMTLKEIGRRLGVTRECVRKSSYAPSASSPMRPTATGGTVHPGHLLLRAPPDGRGGLKRGRPASGGDVRQSRAQRGKFGRSSGHSEFDRFA